MKIFVIIAVLFLMQLAIGQDLVDVYKPYLPRTVISNQSSRKTVNIVLEMYGELDPELIYFYISNLELKFVKKKIDPESNWSYQLANRTKIAKYERKRWIQYSIDRIKEKYPSSQRRSRMISYFNSSSSGVFERSKVKPVEIDVNKKNFFSYLYLSRQKGVIYDENVDYEKLVDKEITKLTGKFASIYQEVDKLSPKRRHDALELAMNYPYLFKDTYLDRFTNTTAFPLYDFGYAALSDDYVNKNSVFIFWQRHMGSVFDQALSMEQTIHFVDPIRIPHDIQYRVGIKNTVFIGGGIKIKTKSSRGMLNYLKISAGFMPKAGYSNGFQSQVFYSGSFSIPGYRFTGDFGITGYRNFKYQVWGAEFTAPLYYFRNNLYLEGGLAYFQRNVSFDYESYVNGILTSPYNLDPPDGFNNEVYKVNFNWHKFVPVLSVLYNVYKTGTVGLSYMGGKSLRLSLSLGLDF